MPFRLRADRRSGCFLARHPRFELGTFGSGVPRLSEAGTAVSLAHGPNVGHEELVQQGIELAEAARARSPDSTRLAEEFAEAVGEALEPINRLVAAAIAGGPFSVRRALELLEVLLQHGPSTSPATGHTSDEAAEG